MRVWLVLVLMIWTSVHALAAGRVALVIGNGDYVNANKLPNPPNDATAMSQALRDIGFTVVEGENLNHSDMARLIGDFEEASRDADVTLFFYAGHGLQVNGNNYLVPIDAKLDRESSLQFEAIDADIVMRSMSGPGKTAIALLDACRDNPLSRSLARSLGKTRSTAVQQGLAVPNITGGGMLIGFATAPGEVAADGEGSDSPFTVALLKNIKTPGLEIQQMMTRVKADVFEATKEKQEPWHNSSLRTEVYLGGSPKAAEPEPVEQKKSPPEPAAASNIEVEWNAVKDTSSIAVLDAFMAAHADNSVFVALAEDRKAQLNAKITSAFLDSLKIPEQPAAPPEPAPSAKQGIKLEALKKLGVGVKPVNPARSSRWTLEAYFDLAKAGNDGQTVYALLGPPNVNLTPPAKNPGSKSRSFSLEQVTTAASLDALLGANSDVTFATDKVTSCRLDWLDRCPFLPASMLDGLSNAMAAKGMDILNHDGNYYMLTPISNGEDYVLSNAPAFRDGTVAVLAAIVTKDLAIREIYGFSLDKTALGVEAGAPEADVELTGAAVEGDDLIMSFDSSQRCTDKPRRFGLIARFSQVDYSLKWVSPFNVSDANLILNNGHLYAANGGSCTDDYLYDLDPASGAINARFKLPSAVERMDLQGDRLLLELYDRADIYRLP